MSKEELIIGIDLGTTNSCIAVWVNGKIEIVPNHLGGRITPSMVGFLNDEKLVGNAAKNSMNRNIENTIFGIKRLIGRDFDDKEVKNDLKYWPFKIIKDVKSKKPKIEIEVKGKKESFFAEQISAMIVEMMKNIAESYLNKEINKAVITCPAYFNDLQRKATQLAGEIAGLEVVRIINEPTAAALAYGYNKDFSNEKNILVFDLGGGTFDVTVLSIQNSFFEVKSSSGDTHLGGDDFDNKLIDHFLNEIKEKKHKDYSNDVKFKLKLKEFCEKIKISLSSNEEVSIYMEDYDYELQLYRSEFEEICKDLFDRCIPIVEQAINDGYLTKDMIQEIILVGGSTRMPKIRSMLKENFPEAEIKSDLQADEIVAYGAAIQGVMINNIEDESIERLVINDVTPLSLGIELKNGEMDVLIERNTNIPYEKTESYQVSKDFNTSVAIKIFQGERLIAKENKYLGEFKICNIPPKKKGEVVINVTFYVDINGILKVTAIDSVNKTEKSLQIQIDNVFDQDTINNMIEEAKKMRKNDEKILQFYTEIYKLREIALKKKNNGNDKEKKMSQEILNWISEIDDYDIDVCKKKYQELMKLK